MNKKERNEEVKLMKEEIKAIKEDIHVSGMSMTEEQLACLYEEIQDINQYIKKIATQGPLN